MRTHPLVLALALVLAACAEDDQPTPEERRAALVDLLAEDLVAETGGALSDAQATCVAEALVDTVGEERFPDVVAAAGGDGDPDLRETVIDVFASCDALDPLVEGAE